MRVIRGRGEREREGKPIAPRVRETSAATDNHQSVSCSNLVTDNSPPQSALNI